MGKVLGINFCLIRQQRRCATAKMAQSVKYAEAFCLTLSTNFYLAIRAAKTKRNWFLLDKTICCPES
jgi:predicted component of type VI protein secretion system